MTSPVVFGHSFKEVKLLHEALTHRSFLHENPNHSFSDNQRLEFLGDSVLQLLVTQKLMLKHPTQPEGILSKLRSSVVNEEMLVKFAQRLDFPKYLYLGHGERELLNDRPSILADAFEAIMGAVYLDAELEGAEAFLGHVFSLFEEDFLALKQLEQHDPKSKLQEFCLKEWKELPVYQDQAFNMMGQIHFRVTLEIRGIPLLSTQQLSKKKAEIYLAKTCLDYFLHHSISERRSHA